MENREPRLYDVKISQLHRLDGFVGNISALDAALGTKLDGCSDEERFLDASLAMYGREVQQTLDMLREGQPGFLYREARRKLLTLMQRNRSTISSGPEPDDSVSPAPRFTNTEISGETRGVQPQQPL